MKIKTVTQKEIITEKEINLPYFFRVGYDRVGAIFSDEKSIDITYRSSYYSVSQCRFSILWENSIGFNESVEITEQEFNSVLAETIFAVAGIEIVNDVKHDPCILFQS